MSIISSPFSLFHVFVSIYPYYLMVTMDGRD